MISSDADPTQMTSSLPPRGAQSPGPGGPEADGPADGATAQRHTLAPNKWWRKLRNTPSADKFAAVYLGVFTLAAFGLLRTARADAPGVEVQGVLLAFVAVATL